MIYFVHVALMTVQRQDNLREWVDSWLGVAKLVGENHKGGSTGLHNRACLCGRRLRQRLKWL
jgi:hypothetical protein